jgi:hypothetical protein
MRAAIVALAVALIAGTPPIYGPPMSALEFFTDPWRCFGAARYEAMSRGLQCPFIQRYPPKRRPRS